MSDREGRPSPAPLAGWSVPLLTWLASNALLGLTAVLSGQSLWSPQARQQWDSQWYLSIASGGYESFRCIERYSNFPDVWCGNTAWFPGYPMAIRAVSWLGLPEGAAAVVVSSGCLLGALAILWHLLGSRLSWRSGCAMALAACFPGVVYFHVVFPTAMCLLGLLMVVLGVRRESWLLAGIGAFVAFSTHLVGVIGVIALALSIAVGWRRFGWPGRLWRVAAATALGLLAYPWTMWLIHAGTGSWTIYWEHQQEAYGNAGLRNPLAQIVQFWNIPFALWYPPAPDAAWLVTQTTTAHQAQLAINLLFAAVVVGTAGWRLFRKDLAAWEVAAVLIAAGAVLVPLLTGAWSAWYRHNALMLVALPVLRLPRPVWLLLIAGCAVQGVLLGSMWFGGSLI